MLELYDKACAEPRQKAGELYDKKHQIQSELRGNIRSAKQTLVATRSDEYDVKQREILDEIEAIGTLNRAGELAIKDFKKQTDNLVTLQSDFDSSRKQGSSVDPAFTQGDEILEARLEAAKRAAAAIVKIEADTQERTKHLPHLESKLAELEKTLFDWREMKFD